MKILSISTKAIEFEYSDAETGEKRRGVDAYPMGVEIIASDAIYTIRALPDGGIEVHVNGIGTIEGMAVIPRVSNEVFIRAIKWQPKD